MSERERFEGRIAGVGTAIGVRVVVGSWRRSPYDRFADVMLAEPDGIRWLLAPSEQIADLVSRTYTFDRVEIGEVTVIEGRQWRVSAPDLDLSLDVGSRVALGRLLRLLCLVPRWPATSPSWCLLTDPGARVVLRGVRTRGSAAHGRRESYGATDLHRVTGVRGTWRGERLGGPAPRRPSVTRLVTTVSRRG